MATITIKYDGRNRNAASVIGLLRTMDFLEIQDNAEYDPAFVAKIRRGENEKTRKVDITKLWK